MHIILALPGAIFAAQTRAPAGSEAKPGAARKICCVTSLPIHAQPRMAELVVERISLPQSPFTQYALKVICLRILQMPASQDQIFDGAEASNAFQVVMTDAVLVQVKSDAIFTLGFETKNNNRILNRENAAEFWELEILSYFWIAPTSEWLRKYKTSSQTHGKKLPYQRKRASQLARLGALQDSIVKEASIARNGDISLTFPSGEELRVRGKERAYDLSWELTCLDRDHKRIDLYFSCDEDGGYVTNVVMR